MRLLNTQTLKIQDFYTGTVPRYAILSHTWETDEVLYQDMIQYRGPTDTVVRRKAGFRKIELSCQRALRDYLQFIWIDTCCIDKTSSAELSEAINSMFDWYQRATVCYAYFGNVPADFETLPDLGDGHALSTKEEDELMRSEFSQSRWFTRGWTLQELIAPAAVKFYGTNFGFIGSKQTLAYLISRITGIDEPLLLGEQPLQEFCVARKMSWAAKRVTTRPEDMAYSLLGLFDVNMSLLYGEGEKAYRRLQEEIIKVSADQSIFAWEDDVDKRKALFAPRPDNFAKSGNIVLWHGEETDEPFRMTNRGLDLRLLLVETISENGAPQGRAILGCRYEDDLTGPIGINVDRMARSGGYPLVPVGPKLSVVPLQDVASAVYQSVSILERPDPNPAFERAAPIQGNQKCWIKFLGSKKGFESHGAYHLRCWNELTGVFVPPRGSSITGGAHFLNQNGMEFILAFGYLRDGALPNNTRFHSEWVSLAEPVEGRSLEQMCISTSIERPSAQRAHLQLIGIQKLKIDVAINTDTVMDETLFVISVTVSDVA